MPAAAAEREKAKEKFPSFSWNIFKSLFFIPFIWNF